jgi:hypothetical protein
MFVRLPRTPHGRLLPVLRFDERGQENGDIDLRRTTTPCAATVSDSVRARSAQRDL